MKNFTYVTLAIYLLNGLKSLGSDANLNKKESLQNDTAVIVNFIELASESSVFTSDTDQSKSNNSICQDILSFSEFKKEEIEDKKECSSKSIASTLSLEDEKFLPKIERGITLYEPYTSNSKERFLGILYTPDDK